MNWWRQLKTWQKWGIAFGGVHVGVYILTWGLVTFSCNVLGNCEGGLLLDLLEYPLYLIVKNPVTMHRYYLLIVFAFYPIFGTVLWSLVGSVLALFWEMIKDRFAPA